MKELTSLGLTDNTLIIYVDDLGVATEYQDLVFEIIDDLATLCGMVIKDAKDVKDVDNMEYIGYHIHLQPTLAVTMKDNKRLTLI